MNAPPDLVIDGPADGVAGLGTVLSIWAHPDDETFLSGATMAAAAAAGQRVVCVSATAGEHGTGDPDTWPPERLGRIRRWEAAAAMAVLGVAEHRFMGLTDGGLARLDAEQPDMGPSLVRDLIAEIEPDTILTFGPDGITFHPDHITIGRWTSLAWEQLGRPGRLLHATSTTEHLARFGELYEQWGVYMTDDRPTGVPEDALAVHTRVRGDRLDQKLAALAAMASQTRDVMTTVDPDLFAAEVSEEAFVDMSRSAR